MKGLTPHEHIPRHGERDDMCCGAPREVIERRQDKDIQPGVARIIARTYEVLLLTSQMETSDVEALTAAECGAALVQVVSEARRLGAYSVRGNHDDSALAAYRALQQDKHAEIDVCPSPRKHPHPLQCLHH